MNVITIVALLVLLVWWYKPLRTFLIQRTNRTVKVLLVVFPLLAAGRLAYRFYTGAEDGSDVVAILVFALLLLWLSLIWLGNWLERRRPTKAQAPDLTILTKLPGMPRVPRVPGVPGMALTSPQVQEAARAAAPHVQRAARAAADAASRGDWDSMRGDVAVGRGRAGGKLAARLRKSMSTK
jgi:hypothetical protein